MIKKILLISILATNYSISQKVYITDTSDVLQKYLMLISISESLPFSENDTTSGKYRLLVCQSESHPYVVAEMISTYGEDEMKQLRYSVILKRSLFLGKYKPGYEGVTIKINKWLDYNQASLSINDDNYLIIFNIDPKLVDVKNSKR
jgi:hypothetical protein